MRNGNVYTNSNFQIENLFLPYLWGMETPSLLLPSWQFCQVLTVPMRNGNQLRELITQCDKLLFLPYLWGMETEWSRIFGFNESWVLTVPMRNGNCVGKGDSKAWGCVLTVPMRNGNIFLRSSIKFKRLCSYRTYEEWKRLLPLFVYHAERFLPYLWGMETF